MCEERIILAEEDLDWFHQEDILWSWRCWIVEGDRSSLHVNVWHCDRKNYAYILFYIIIDPSSVASPERILSKRLGRSAQEGSKSLDEPLLVMWPSWQVADGCALDMTICSFLAFIPFAASLPCQDIVMLAFLSHPLLSRLISSIDVKKYCVSSSKACACRIRRFLRQVVTEVHARASWSWPVWAVPNYSVPWTRMKLGMQWMTLCIHTILHRHRASTKRWSLFAHFASMRRCR